jgi:hypothetical protein
MLSFSSVEDVILFHGVNVIIFEGLDVIIFHGVPYMLSFLKHWVHPWSWSFQGVIIYVIIWCYHLFYVIIWCYHFLMLSFDVIIWCYRLVLSLGVIIYFMLSFDVIISHSLQLLSFCVIIFLVQDGCYHLCYHLMLSFFVIVSPLFSFSWKRDTLNFSQLSKKWRKRVGNHRKTASNF